MLQFKTVAIPATTLLVKGKDLYTDETAAKVVAPVGERIAVEARNGWQLHSLEVLPGTVFRKKGILEVLLGWIPIIGELFIPKEPDVIFPQYYTLIFQKEV